MDIFNYNHQASTRWANRDDGAVTEVLALREIVIQTMERNGCTLTSETRRNFQGLEIEEGKINEWAANKENIAKLQKFAEAVVIGEQLALWSNGKAGGNYTASSKFLGDFFWEFVSNTCPENRKVEIGAGEIIQSHHLEKLVQERFEQAAALFSQAAIVDIFAQKKMEFAFAQERGGNLFDLTAGR